jgi:hypothetical protein
MQRNFGTSSTVVAAKAGVIYFLLIFAAGFLLGVIRIKLVIPNFGALAGLLIELPLILTLSWLACRLVIRKLRVPADIQPRLVMGAVALALMLLSETAVAIIGLDQRLGAHIDQYGTVNGLIGLAALLLFAAMPLLRITVTRARLAG